VRDEILEGVRHALQGRERLAHPGDAPSGSTPAVPDPDDVLQRFQEVFEAAGGEVVRLPALEAAKAWGRSFAGTFSNAAQARDLPVDLRIDLPAVDARQADLGVSLAVHAIAETGSLLLSSREGRAVQLLPPVHLVWVPRGVIRRRLADALEESRDGGASALALHSGPSKSADIGRIIVTGVHGPGRVIAAVVG
jgi:L-lactate dehydrogenase complex protein LldG